MSEQCHIPCSGLDKQHYRGSKGQWQLTCSQQCPSQVMVLASYLSPGPLISNVVFEHSATLFYHFIAAFCAVHGLTTPIPYPFPTTRHMSYFSFFSFVIHSFLTRIVLSSYSLLSPEEKLKGPQKMFTCLDKGNGKWP